MSKFDNSQDAYSSAVADSIAPAGQNAFTGCPARGQDDLGGNRKRGPKSDGKLSPQQAHEAHNASAREWYARKINAERTAKLLAIPSRDILAHEPKSVKVAHGRFASV